MNRVDLIAWLKACTPMELELRGHFETYRKPVSQYEFYQNFQKYDRADTSSTRGQFHNLEEGDTSIAHQPFAGKERAVREDHKN